jgi:hypothetical protein
VAAYYDTPVISLRDVLLPRILNDPTSNPAPGGVLGPEGQVGLEVKKWFRNVPEEERIEGDAKVVDGVDLMHVSRIAETVDGGGLLNYFRERPADQPPRPQLASRTSHPLPSTADSSDGRLRPIPRRRRRRVV